VGGGVELRQAGVEPDQSSRLSPVSRPESDGAEGRLACAGCELTGGGDEVGSAGVGAGVAARAGVAADGAELLVAGGGVRRRVAWAGRAR
jgi:hypothetical protein